MDIFAAFATDPNKELDGVWIDLGPAERNLPDGSPDPESVPKIKVARNGNKRHSRIVTSLYEANKTALDRKDDAADALNEKLTIQAAAQGLLLGWKNLEIKQRKLGDQWNQEDATALLSIKDFREMVMSHAIDRKNFSVEDAAKNSPQPSNGS